MDDEDRSRDYFVHLVQKDELSWPVLEIVRSGLLVMTWLASSKKMRLRQLRDDELLFSKMWESCKQLSAPRTYFGKRSLECQIAAKYLEPLVEEMQLHVQDASELDGGARIMAEIASYRYFMSRNKSSLGRPRSGDGAKSDPGARVDYSRRKAKEQYARKKKVAEGLSILEVRVLDPSETLAECLTMLAKRKLQLESEAREASARCEECQITGRLSRKESPIDNAKRKRLLKETTMTLNQLVVDLRHVKRDLAEAKFSLDEAHSKARRVLQAEKRKREELALQQKEAL